MLQKTITYDTQFMHPDLFEDQPLSDAIKDISDKEAIVTPKKIINIVAKYLYAYCYPDSVDKKIPLKDIEYIVDQAHRFFRISREKRGTVVELTK